MEEAVRTVIKLDITGGITHETDVHWVHQRRFCGGLLDTLQYYDTITQLDPLTSHYEVARILQNAGVNYQDVEEFNNLFPGPAPEGGDTAKYEEKYEKIASENNPEILEIPSK